MSGSITSLTGATTATAGAGSAGTRLSGDLNTFLKLLTTQLQNQDPTAPMDADQLTQQLVQFSTVEQQINTNTTLQQLLALQQASQLGEAASLVGRRVAVETDRLPLQSGSATVNLPAAGTARLARVEVRDANNLLVRSSDVTLGTAPMAWNWDGKDNGGTQRADGLYRVTVSGRDSAGAAVPLGFTVTGQVTGALRDNGTVTLRMGGLNIGYDRLRDLGG
ncbi:flagellar hook assembly protein FlgD [Falsiroseomonas sp.]|uniref:flagellar hook assembly protein FlgD n=1 Tax=Falsiroseomonas sp. TaxID=2870721 RepID=UPI0027238DF5|nr:flagellar hook assembly protein FlgD [Falsiroseomonas sp.]MDO9503557.1 flagellar hook assembly protein FlgD [Falsiroseomonas sp.]MDP3414516.1 flagellar hook assembly protein FlgD [Falsiroseomonas sp.]